MKANKMPERIYLFDYNDAMVTPLEGDTVYVKESAFIEKAWSWIEYNMLSSNQQDKSRFHCEQFRKYMKGEKV